MPFVYLGIIKRNQGSWVFISRLFRPYIAHLPFPIALSFSVAPPPHLPNPQTPANRINISQHIVKLRQPFWTYNYAFPLYPTQRKRRRKVSSDSACVCGAWLTQFSSK